MHIRKWALVLGAAASCAGCVTENKNISLSAENFAQVKDSNVKQTEFPKRDAKPHTWVAVGEVAESKLNNHKLTTFQQNTCREEARQAYQKALELDPKCAEAHVHLANLYLRADDVERAAAVYETALAKNPKSAALWHGQGLLQCRRKDYNAAVQSLGKAHDLDNKADFAKDYGYCLARAGRPQDAVGVLSQVMTKADANYNVARMMAHVNQADLSRQFVTAALNERPTHSEALALLVQLNSGRGGQAGAVASNPTDPNFQQATMKTQR